MAVLEWDRTGERRYETGTDHGVFYLQNASGEYDKGYAWNGLTGVTESPSGAEASPQYADNIKYLNLVSAEEFGATIEAFTYPDEFGVCDGTASPEPGVVVGQQRRHPFGFSWRTKVGTDLDGDAGYKIHLVWNALAAPSEKAYTTVNDSPEALTFSWELTTTPVNVGKINNVDYKPTASMTLDSTKVNADRLLELEQILYGTAGADPRMPLPAEVITLFSGSTTEVTPIAPSYDAGAKTITIPVVTGVVYKINNAEISGDVVIDEDTIVTATPVSGYRFPAVVDNDWLFEV